MRPDDDNGTRCELELELYALAELPPGRMAVVRTHLEGCASCRSELAAWNDMVAGARQLQEDLASVTTPMAEALPALMAALDSSPPDSFAPEPDLERAGFEESGRASTVEPVQRQGRLSPVALAATCAALLVIGVFIATIILATTSHEPANVPGPGDSSGGPGVDLTMAPSHVTLDGEAFIIAQGADLGAHDRWDLLLEEDDWLFRLGGIALHVSPGARLRQGERGPPPRVELQRGSIEVLAPQSEPLIVRIDELEIFVDEGAIVVIDARDFDPAAGSGSVRVGVWEGQVALGELGFSGASEAALGELGAGDAITLRLEDGAVTPGTLAVLEREVEGGLLPELDARLASGVLPPSAQIPVDDLDPDGDTTADGGTGTESTPEVDGGESTVVEPTEPTGPRELPPGTMQVNLVGSQISIGEVVELEITVGAGEAGLGSYRLELEFQPRGSNLKVELASDPTGVSGRPPFVSSFDAATQTLQVIDTTFSREPLGVGTFTVLRLRMRVLAGSVGSHQVGGTVVQILDPHTDPLGTPRLQTRGTIDLR